MSRIKILPDILSNKIAAGEVVERPASVVKELVENALDADSGKILVEVEKGGKSLIRVSDDGIGMSHDDALLSIERFATSKLLDDSGLFSIQTLGFRGEALPSIASVSRFAMVTRDSQSDSGLDIRINGGKLVKAAETGCPVGTMVSVGQLFFNTPARRKFLKTVNTEMSHVGDVVGNLAMGRPEVSFRLTHNGREIKRWSGTDDPLRRIADVLGTSAGNDLHRVEHGFDGIDLFGAVASPRIYRSNSRSVHIYVNGRYVRDRMISHAIFEGFGQRLMKGQFPVAVLFIRVPPDTVDVNVHPTKHEVRFREHKKVHEVVREAVRSTLAKGKGAQAPDRMQPSFAKQDPSGPGRFFEPHSKVAESYRSFETSASPQQTFRGPSAGGAMAGPALQVAASSEPEKEVFEKIQAPLWPERKFADMKVIGQCHDTYIILETPEGLILLDQHAAHERILYERLKNKSESEKPQAQQLLVPETFDLNFSQADILEKLLERFDRLGLGIEPFGGNTFVVKSVPSLLEGKTMEPMIRQIVEKAQDIGVSSDISQAFDAGIKLMACHGAIRARQRLSAKQIESLLGQLDQCENPSNCPHGRPTWIRWSLKFLEKSFHRIV